MLYEINREFTRDLLVYKQSGRRKLTIMADVSGGGRGEGDAKCYHAWIMGPRGSTDGKSQTYCRTRFLM